MFQLGKLEGKVDAVLSSQHDQASVNAENKREHDEFRKQLGDHQEAIAVLKDDRQTSRLNRSDAVQKWMAILGIPSSIIALGGVIAWIVSTHP